MARTVHPLFGRQGHSAMMRLVAMGLLAAAGHAGCGPAATGPSREQGEQIAAPPVSAPPVATSEPSADTTQPPPGPAPEGMVWVPGGSFWMGSDDPAMTDARPVHRVRIDGFWMDATEVTNAQFKAFVDATGYRTVAERPPDPKQFPDAPPENLVAGSIVFQAPEQEVTLDNAYQWWVYVKGASWLHPEGPSSSIDDRMNHPVVHICHDDAVAYAKWAGKRLPTEAEWEYAARGGLERQRYVWGNEFQPDGKWQVNNWQGQFPRENTRADGYAATAPVGSFPANGYGLFDMAGNAWEWCSDWYRPEYYRYSPRDNPAGPDSSFDPSEPSIPKRVQRGGSFMCSDLYCTRYLPGARGKGAPDSAANHVGFRCVRSPR